VCVSVCVCVCKCVCVYAQDECILQDVSPRVAITDELTFRG